PLELLGALAHAPTIFTQSREAAFDGGCGAAELGQMRVEAEELDANARRPARLGADEDARFLELGVERGQRAFGGLDLGRDLVPRVARELGVEGLEGRSGAGETVAGLSGLGPALLERGFALRLRVVLLPERLVRKDDVLAGADELLSRLLG